MFVFKSSGIGDSAYNGFVEESTGQLVSKVEQDQKPLSFVNLAANEL